MPWSNLHALQCLQLLFAKNLQVIFFCALLTVSLSVAAVRGSGTKTDHYVDFLWAAPNIFFGSLGCISSSRSNKPLSSLTRPSSNFKEATTVSLDGASRAACSSPTSFFQECMAKESFSFTLRGVGLESPREALPSAHPRTC